MENNLIVYNKPENCLYINYWGNTLTGKITGTIIKLSKYTKEEEKQKVINYVKSHYSIAPLDCYYVELNVNKDEELEIKTKLS